MDEIEKKNTLYFKELSINQLWNRFLNNKTIISYFQEYGAHESSQIHFFFQYSLYSISKSGWNDDLRTIQSNRFAI